MQKQLLYDMMNGFLEDIPVSEDNLIENEFAEGKEGAELYENVYLAKTNLCGRLGVNEDKDIETIIDCMEKITRLLAMKMYEYGFKYGK